MKTLFSIILLLTTSLNASTVMVQSAPTHNGDKELSWVDEQIHAILPSRIGVADGYISSLKDPMKMKGSTLAMPARSPLLAPPSLNKLTNTLTAPTVVEEPLRLNALMNKSALINGKWYRVGEAIRTFTLAEIKNNSVLLTGKKDQKLLLFLSKQNNNIKITTK